MAMDRNCDECKFENTGGNNQPCCSCMDFEHTQWQPKEETKIYTEKDLKLAIELARNVTTLYDGQFKTHWHLTKEEIIEQILTIHEHNK